MTVSQAAVRARLSAAQVQVRLLPGLLPQGLNLCDVNEKTMKAIWR